MDNVKIGRLLYTLRKENGMTQMQLAERMNISDKTVSKWERGIGCPDISLLSALARIFSVSLDELLEGELAVNRVQGGSLKKTEYYVCRNCGNLFTSLADASVFCCGKRLMPLEMKKAEGNNMLKVERIENDYFISSVHDMTKEHYISFVTLLTDDTIVMRKLYPEWNMQLRIPAFAHGGLVWYCTQHGLLYQNI